VLWDFFGLWPMADADHVIAVLTHGGHVFEGAGASGPEWPSVTAFNLSGRRPILSYAEGDLEFGPQMMYFMGGWPTGTWADIQRVYEAYAGHKIGDGKVHPRIEEGSIVTDAFLRHLLQTKERLLPWSAFRRLLIGRGLVWHSELPALNVEPVEVERPAMRRLSFGSAPMEIDEDAAAPVAPSDADINAFMARVDAQKSADAIGADPFEELDDLWAQVWEEMEYVDDCDYHIALMEELLTVCLRDEYAVAWRTNTFKRLQMRAALRTWTETHGGVEIVYRFLRTYPA
jgi:hypothetical protein